MLCSGQPITSPKGHCHFWGGEVTDAGYEAVIERQLAHAVDWIKVMATGGINTKGTSIREAQFDAAQAGPKDNSRAAAAARVDRRIRVMFFSIVVRGSGRCARGVR